MNKLTERCRLPDAETLKALNKYPTCASQPVRLAHPVEEYIRIIDAQITKAIPIIQAEERARLISVIENLNSIGYAYGAEYKTALLQILKEGEA